MPPVTRYVVVRRTYKVCQVHMAIGIQQDVVGLHIPMYDALLVYVFEGAAQFCNPEAYGLLGEGLPRYVKS